MKLPRLLHERRRRLFARLVANGLAQAATAIGIALLVRGAFAQAAAGSPAPLDWRFASVMGLLAAAIALNAVLRVVERADAVRLGEDYVTRIRLRLFDAVTAGPVLTMTRRGLGSTMLRFVTDLTAVRQWISDGLARLIVASLAAAGGLIALAVIDPLIGLAVAGVTLAAVAAALALGRPLRGRIRHARRRRAGLASQVADRLRALAVVQLSGRARRERRLLARHSRALARAAVARARLAGMVRVVPEAALGCATLVVLVVGGMRLAGGESAHGTMLAALAVLGALAPQVRALGRVFEYWKNYQVAAGKLRQVLAGPPRRRRAGRRRPAEPVAGRLAFEDVTVEGALAGVTAVAEPRSLVAVVGPSGAGKSSLLAAAGRLLRLDGGRILFDGVDVLSFDAESYARRLGMASGDLPLLKGSIRRNLTYRAGGVTAEDLAETCRLCGLDEDLARLPDGLATRVTEQSADIPHGLRQRLALARAMLGGPAVLLLDDPDRGLDPAGRAALDRMLELRRCTTLMATHDLERVRVADAVWYLEGGRLLEAGSPAAVLSAGGPTARFFRTRTGARHALSASVVRLEPRRAARR
ncbi:MAG: ATP-binding cassette domain-containing protein [Kiloniellaceae bacterium]